MWKIYLLNTAPKAENGAVCSLPTYTLEYDDSLAGLFLTFTGVWIADLPLVLISCKVIESENSIYLTIESIFRSKTAKSFMMIQ